MTASDKDLADLSALNARFIHNFVTRDVPSHDAILHPRFLSIGKTGKYTSRSDYLRAWATAFDPNVIVYWDLRDERIDIFGDTALVRAANKQTIRVGNSETTSMTVYTDTYQREDGRWLCIQAQITIVAPEYYPPDSTILRRYVRGELQPDA